jgi:hypothetical protein
MVHYAHLFILQIHASSFGVGQQGEKLLFLLQHSIRKLSMGSGSRMVQSLILIDAMSSADWRKTKKEKDKYPEFFFPSAGEALLTVPCGIFVAVSCS